jgi:CPA2 family monovalent cation:H+ antiporter-2
VIALGAAVLGGAIAQRLGQPVLIGYIIAFLPVLTDDTGNLAWSLVRSFGTAVVALVLVIIAGAKVAPRLFRAVARTESRDLFLVMIVLVALGTTLDIAAFLTPAIG